MTRIRSWWWWAFGAALVWGLPGRLSAQEEPNANAPQPPPAEQPGATLSIPEALERAQSAIGAAEKGGADAPANLRKAEQLGNYVLANDPINKRATFILGRCELLEGRGREAMGKIDAYVRSPEGESDWLGYKLLGDIHNDGKYYKMARTKYEKAATLNPNESSIFVGLARVELQLHYYDEAIEHARRGVELDRESLPAPYTILARTLVAAKQFEEADGAIQRAIDLTLVKIRNDPGDTDLLRELDFRYQIVMQIQASILSAYPERPEPYLRIATLVQNRADLARLLAYHDALQPLTMGLERTAPNTPASLYYEVAKLQYAVGRNDDALANLKNALEKDPNHVQAQELLQTIEREQGKAPP